MQLGKAVAPLEAGFLLIPSTDYPFGLRFLRIKSLPPFRIRGKNQHGGLVIAARHSENVKEGGLSTLADYLPSAAR